MIRGRLAALAALLLCACQAAPNGPERTVEKGIVRQGGSWTLLHYTMAFDASGVTGGMRDLVAAGQASIGKKDFGGPVCLSAAQAAKDDIAARLAEALQLGKEWKVIRSDISAGAVDFAASMDDPKLGRGTITIVGTISPTTTDLLVTTDGFEPAPGAGHIHTVMKQENTRVGDCTAGEDPWL
jgi:hypothetical protein